MHGFNLVGLPGDYSPPGWFVRAFFLRELSSLNHSVRTCNDSIRLAQSILDNVHITKSAVSNPPAGNKHHGHTTSSMANLEFTQWALVKSPQRRLYMVRSW